MSLVAEIISSAIEWAWLETVVAAYRRFGLVAAVMIVLAPIAVIAGGIAILLRT